MEPEIEQEGVQDAYENFVDVSKVPHLDIIKPSHALLNCSVILNRVKVEPSEIVDIEKINIKGETCENKDFHVFVDNEAKSIQQDDESDFEWPQDDDDATNWSISEIPEKKDQTTVKVNNEAFSAKRKGFKYLPFDLVTPEILSLPQEYITIDGIEYKIRKIASNKVKTKKKALCTDTDSTDYSQRKSTPEYLEEDKKINEYFDLKCRFCNDDVKFANFMRYTKHYKRFHPGEKIFPRCTLCKNHPKFRRRFTMLEHIKFHIANGYKCSICNNDRTYKCLKTHMKRKHLNQIESKNFICDTCGKAFNKSSTLKSHLEVHREKNFECYICHRTAYTEKRLKNHINIRHPLEKLQLLICEICSKLVKENSMKTHVKNHQTNNLRVKCTLCDLWLIESYMKRHMKIHSGDFNGFCTECNRHFKFLSLHMKAVHSGKKKNFSCKECNKDFRETTKLQEHIAVHHTREFPFPCHYCDRQFRIKNGLLLHVKRYHPEEYENRLLPRCRIPNEEAEYYNTN